MTERIYNNNKPIEGLLLKNTMYRTQGLIIQARVKCYVLLFRVESITDRERDEDRGSGSCYSL